MPPTLIDFDGHADAHATSPLRAVERTTMTEPSRSRSRHARPSPRPAFEEIEVDAPRVGIIMGSKNDKPKMQQAGEALEEPGIRYEVRVMSAHRDPETVADYCRNARMRGLQGDHRRRRDVGGAAGRRRRPHRPAGDRRADLAGQSLGGLDALLSVVQMPPGVPVACVGDRRRARTPALLAARILELLTA